MTVQIPSEADRLEALRSLAVRPVPEPEYDAVCRTACALFNAPIAWVSLVEADSQWFKARCGLDLDGTTRGASFCTHTIRSDEILVIEDASQDPRFVSSPLVRGDAGVRFYAGAPLVLGPGLRLGALCIVDRMPRRFSERERAQLQDLAQVVMAQLQAGRAAREARESAASFRLLAESTSDMITRCDLQGTRLYVSPASETLLGYRPEELIGTKPRDLIHPDDAEAYGRLLGQVRSGAISRAVTQHRYRHKDGSWVWVEVSFGLARADEGEQPAGYIAAVRDVSRRKEAEDRMAHMARHDPLTDLPNRLLFREELDRALARLDRDGTGFALLCLDLDHFKSVNDTLGHQAGDRLLRVVAGRIRGVLRRGDVAARLGGDEFVIIQAGCAGPEDAMGLAARVVEAMAAPVDLGGYPTGIGISIGIALAPCDARAPEDLLARADVALYRAKAAGRNTWRLAEGEAMPDAAPLRTEAPGRRRAAAAVPAMRAETASRVRIGGEVRAALAAHEIVPFYQPKVCCRTGQVSGFEALARWQHPTRGVLTPGYFGAAFEDQDLATAIGDTLLRQVAADMRAWNAGGLAFGRVAVNVSSAEFRKPDLAGSILEVLAAYGVPTTHFELEVTETVFLGQGAENVPAVLNRLHDSGVLVTLDDFGTGFASLTHLKQFPVDHIKVDQSFVRNMEQDGDDAAIVAAVVGLGRSLGMRVTAEGVERPGQVERLRALGCDYAQGYQFAKPMAASRVPYFLRSWVLSAPDPIRFRSV